MKNLLIIFVLIVSLVVAIELTGKNQETRGRATINCLTPDQVKTDSRCLYILNGKIYEMGSKTGPHMGHTCGIDVSNIIPAGHLSNASRFLTGQYRADICVMVPTIILPTNTIRPSVTMAPVIPTNTIQPTATVTPVLAPTSLPTPTIIYNGEPILKLKVTSEGVSSGAWCAGNWFAQITVVGKRQSQTYTNVLLVPNGEVDGKMVYSVELLLTGMTETNDLAVFIKGPRHLQVKYGVDGQDFFYNQPYGLISLTTDPNTTPNLNFTNYPLKVGDVFGENGTQDGVVDGLDFSFVKTEVNKRTVGQDMMADLNGNCQLESQDLVLLMMATKDKQEQLY